MDTEKLTIPPGDRLIHIGPHKTGSTALQYALHAAREQLTEHGVVYPGTEHQPRHAACAVTGAIIAKGAGKPKLGDWKALCTEVAEAGDDQRVVISSEYFSNADDDAARTIVEGLGGERVHIVVTLRPLLRILPSQWQEYVKGGLRMSYEDWLHHMFRVPPYIDPTPSFWRRHQHGRLVERWANLVGPDKLTVVTVDEAEPLLQLRLFEKFAGLPDGLLVPSEKGSQSNGSLTYTEAELMRTINMQLRKHKLGADEYGQLVRRGMALRMLRVPGRARGEDRIPTPAWAVTEAVSQAEEATTTISELGVPVIGDLSSLAKRPDSAPESEPPQTVPLALAATAAAGGVVAARKELEIARTPPPPPTRLQDFPVGEVDSRTLLRVVAQRGMRRLRRRGKPAKQAKPAA